LSNSSELLKPNAEVTDEGLQTEIGNLKAENEKLMADYDALLKSSTDVTHKLQQEVHELRSQFETECADQEKIEAKFCNLKQNFAPAATVSEKLTLDAATILSQLRAKRKKSKTDLVDLEAILQILKS
jgi:uncharacterized protein (DUF3084 family)